MIALCALAPPMIALHVPAVACACSACLRCARLRFPCSGCVHLLCVPWLCVSALCAFVWLPHFLLVLVGCFSHRRVPIFKNVPAGTFSEAAIPGQFCKCFNTDPKTLFALHRGIVLETLICASTEDNYSKHPGWIEALRGGVEENPLKSCLSVSRVE